MFKNLFGKQQTRRHTDQPARMASSELSPNMRRSASETRLVEQMQGTSDRSSESQSEGYPPQQGDKSLLTGYGMESQRLKAEAETEAKAQASSFRKWIRGADAQNAWEEKTQHEIYVKKLEDSFKERKDRIYEYGDGDEEEKVLKIVLFCTQREYWGDLGELRNYMDHATSCAKSPVHVDERNRAKAVNAAEAMNDLLESIEEKIKLASQFEERGELPQDTDDPLVNMRLEREIRRQAYAALGETDYRPFLTLEWELKPVIREIDSYCESESVSDECYEGPVIQLIKDAEDLYDFHAGRIRNYFSHFLDGPDYLRVLEEAGLAPEDDTVSAQDFKAFKKYHKMLLEARYILREYGLPPKAPWTFASYGVDWDAEKKKKKISEASGQNPQPETTIESPSSS